MILQKFNINVSNDISDKIVKEVFNSFPSKNVDNVFAKMVKNTYPPRWLQPILTEVETALDRPLHRYWFNIMPTNSKIEWHKHWKNPEVAVLYIQVPDNESPIQFNLDPEIVTIHPYTGLLIKFPGSIEHRVLVNKNKDYRISIAFDLL